MRRPCHHSFYFIFLLYTELMGVCKCFSPCSFCYKGINQENKVTLTLSNSIHLRVKQLQNKVHNWHVIVLMYKGRVIRPFQDLRCLSWGQHVECWLPKILEAFKDRPFQGLWKRKEAFSFIIFYFLLPFGFSIL